MFTGNDMPDLGGLFISLTRIVAFLAAIVVILGGYELIRLACWVCNHVHIN